MTPKTEKILLFVVFVFCLAMRLAFISQKNLWFDEVFSWHLSMNSFYEIIVRTSNDIHPPLYYFTLKIWNFIFGDSVASMRLLSALFTSAAIFFIYPVSRRIMNPLQSFLVIILYSISPLNLYYSQEVRMSAMNLFLNIGSVYFLLKLCDTKHDYHRIFKDRFSILYLIFTTAALYTHYFSFFILAGEVVYTIAVNRKETKQLIAYLYIYAGILLAYLIWIPELIAHMSRGQSWRTSQSLMQALDEYLYFARDLNLGLYYYYTDYDMVRYITYFIGFVLFVVLIGIIIKWFKTDNNAIYLILLAFFVPLILAGIISIKQKIEFYRYLSILVPYISILIVYGLFKWKYKVISYLLLTVYMGINVYGMNIHYSFNFKNDDYRELIGQINKDYQAGDKIYVEPHYYGWAIDYYKKQESLQIPKTAFVRYGWGEILDSISTQKPQRFWIVLDYGVTDTSQYSSYINGLTQKYSLDYIMTYPLAPEKVELYRFK
ncbi:MAG: glycosyltransferase family 39 protein [Ignavibacteria bacterium]